MVRGRLDMNARTRLKTLAAEVFGTACAALRTVTNFNHYVDMTYIPIVLPTDG